MKADKSKGGISLWIVIVNIAIIAAMIVTLALYISMNISQAEVSGRDTIQKSTADISDSVYMFFVSQHRTLYNHHAYISPADGAYLSYNEAVAYLQKANADPTVNYQIIDPATYLGESLIGGAKVAVDYTSDTYASIREACDIVRTGEVQYDTIRSTAVFANSSNGAASSIAFFTDITVNTGGRHKSYALFAVIETKNIVFGGLPHPAYEDASSCIINREGDYIVKDVAHFRNSENFFKFLRVYNDLTYPQMSEIAAQMTGSEAGILRYHDYRKVDCYYSYDSIAGTDGWYYVASIPVASTAGLNIDYIFTLILLVFLGILITVNGMRMKYLNDLLKSHVAQLDEARKAADSANDAKTLFLTHMSHEMRTPLTAIMGIGMIAEEKSTDPEVKALLKKTISASEHMVGLINDVLDISKIGEGKLILHNEPFSLEEMTEALSAIYGINANEKSISLLFTTDIRIHRYIIGDQLHLRQVITNLVNNAIKYNSPGGFVKVIITQVGEVQDDRIRVRFEVEDDGFGISEEKKRDIFEPFMRDYTDKTKTISGTGLGLAISNELVSAMGGQIMVESTLGVGSKFYFELVFRLGEEIVPKEEKEKRQWTEQTLAGRRVLVAEDNAMNAYIVENLLSKTGAEVILAANGQEALELIQNNPDGHFDLVLMDILMPILDGYEATQKIRQLAHAYVKTLPIVALSANAFNEDVESSLSHGMQAHIAKPINVEIFYKTILGFLE